MKKFAFFLPQYHEIPENNEWWGKGFTEWTNVKKAKPLYTGHIQPIHPLDENYYNLLDKKTVVWQTNLMKEYDVDGFIYYHYYFKGKMLLEKPAENLLSWKDINQPFFFCWANHDWNRSWNGKQDVIQKQEYGDEKDWEKHFDYLLPFFKDDRYEKHDNQPVFMVYKCDFTEKKKMFDYFDKKCKENGFAGIYLIESFNGGRNFKRDTEEFVSNLATPTKKVFLREHSTSLCIYNQLYRYYPIRIVYKFLGLINKNKFILKYNGNKFYDLIMKYEYFNNRYIHGLFFNWDNTPRHGNRGFIVEPPDKTRFMVLMDRLKNEDYVFLNAWNEWAEGMVLEPSKEYGYKYLKWIKEWSEKNGD